MTAREYQEILEKDILSPNACLVVNSKGRKQEEQPCPLRTDFCRDRDRIIHSKAFRRLKTKTQVFLAPEGDHFRTRLTHTLEVAQISRTIARALKLNEDLTEAIAMGHDLGHTPFGHAGERALNELNPNGFAHFKQSVRVLNVLEKYPTGLNVTAEVEDGILNHTKADFPATWEGQIVRYCDRIAYINHDIEDCITAGLLTEEDIPNSARELLGNSKSARITTLLNDLLLNSSEKIGFSPQVDESFINLHSFMFEKIYVGSVAKVEEKKVFHFISELYRYYCNNPKAMPQMYLNICDTDGIDTAVTDYISGMSDSFAATEFENIYIPRRWSILNSR